MKLGDVIEVKVDPDTNEGFDTAPALVTGVYEDGSLRVRVFGSTSVQDTSRNHVGDDGEPYQYPAAEAAPAAGSQPEPINADDVDVNEDVDALSDEQAAKLQAALDARSSRQQPPA